MFTLAILFMYAYGITIIIYNRKEIKDIIEESNKKALYPSTFCILPFLFLIILSPVIFLVDAYYKIKRLFKFFIQ